MKEFEIKITIKDNREYERVGYEDIMIVFDTENYHAKRGFIFEGYSNIAKDIQDWILGEIARLSIEDILKRK